MRVSFAGRDYDLQPGESVLEGLARHGVRLPSACQAGVCHACLVRAVRGDPGPESVRGLKPTWRARGYFLACVARPRRDLTVAAAGADTLTPAAVRSTRWLGPGVLGVRVVPRRPLSFRPGQHVTLRRPDDVVRAYSIANLPAEARRDGLEFHVRVHDRGTMSCWLARTAPGAPVWLGEPAGECFYLPGDPDGPLLLAGTGTGIAPLLAVARDALAHGHRGPVVVAHGAARPSGLYLGGDGPPRCLRDASATLRWRSCALSRGDDIADAVTEELAALGDPAGCRAYLCGGRRSVARMRKALFLAGMSLRDVALDEFLPAVP